jgi:hypothetical protein
MKAVILLIAVCVMFTACKNQAQTATTKNDSLQYPFKAKYSINWQPGDEKNAVLVLNCLKKYVAGDIKGSTSYFADTCEFIADKFHFKGSRDSLTKIIADMRNASVTVSKNFDSWATMYYPDKKDTWVTLWYTEKTTDKKGKVDSIYFTDDVLVKNGKIIVYDEKQRLFPDKLTGK